jgi:hypothetical protein
MNRPHPSPLLKREGVNFLTPPLSLQESPPAAGRGPGVRPEHEDEAENPGDAATYQF